MAERRVTAASRPRPSPITHRGLAGGLPDPTGSAPSCEACILAGGLSSRMGHDKARLLLGGKSLLAHIRAIAQQANFPVRVIRRDLVARCGPLGGVFTALKTTRADAVLFLSCDMPFITAELLNRMRERLRPATRAVFVRHERWGFPFLIRRPALDQVDAMLAEGQFSLQALADKLEAVPVRMPRRRPWILFNINTQEDYTAARKLASSAVTTKSKRS